MAGTTKTQPRFIDAAGALSIAECQITFAAADARVLICGVPEGAIVLDAWFELETAFDSGTSDELNIGWGAVGAATSNDILDAVDAKGGSPDTVYPATRAVPAIRMTAAQDLYAYHLTVGTDPTVGSARAYVIIARTADNYDA